ncbi:expressed unknown protein [Seminavis robusta]|uniref:Uncharacterized protein n=1 Tax=Seminavis robusta TaxID=568900 RepID=A0A9N8E962_9STRA|nr:expressed unknown protein [Seminavis robusta]|eukprot:Sro826_g207741.1  (116) ;mRNA; r:35740-36087
MPLPCAFDLAHGVAIVHLSSNQPFELFSNTETLSPQPEEPRSRGEEAVAHIFGYLAEASGTPRDPFLRVYRSRTDPPKPSRRSWLVPYRLLFDRDILASREKHPYENLDLLFGCD